jgi:hypothetical protein
MRFYDFAYIGIEEFNVHLLPIQTNVAKPNSISVLFLA